ncbi:hypothetical protein J4G62_06430 [Aeromonas caviae]|uniref:hypothetical protein n=1 Tax=Aeromonas caviae TaxID=648 RepID=UPI001BD1F712|nr:hypothetical protein [Aeromonas caviae]MBS4719886.1 hypothetical protein [Aeromonas caviae]
MSKLLTLYALLAMGKIEPTWPKRNRPSDIPGQSPGDIWGSDRVLKEENAPSVVLSWGMVVFSLFREHKDVERKVNTVRLIQNNEHLVLP